MSNLFPRAADATGPWATLLSPKAVEESCGLIMRKSRAWWPPRLLRRLSPRKGHREDGRCHFWAPNFKSWPPVLLLSVCQNFAEERLLASYWGVSTIYFCVDLSSIG